MANRLDGEKTASLAALETLPMLQEARERQPLFAF